MKYSVKNLLKRIVLVLVLCALATTLLAAHAAGTQGSSPPDSEALSPGAVAGITQNCYTIDTSRPEWLGWDVYLPVVLKGYAP
jgi:hypothetical protein